MRRLLLSSLVLAAAAAAAAVPSVRGTVVVTTSMLESAARELLPADAPLELVSLAPPGTCPGHFDLSPRMVPLLHRADVLVRHDFQAGLDKRLSALGLDGLRVVPAAAEGSLLVPRTYLGLVDQVEGALAAELPGRMAELAAARAATAARLAGLEAEVRATAAPWRGRKVLAGAQQAAFCSWLGLDVIGRFDRPEQMSPRELEELLALDPQAVVGNLQSDADTAISLGARLGVGVAMLSNFPGAPGYGTTYDDLVRADLDRLAAAWTVR